MSLVKLYLVQCGRCRSIMQTAPRDTPRQARAEVQRRGWERLPRVYVSNGEQVVSDDKEDYCTRCVEYVKADIVVAKRRGETSFEARVRESREV